ASRIGCLLNSRSDAGDNPEGGEKASLAVRANPFAHCTGLMGEIAVRSAAFGGVCFLIARKQLTHRSRIEAAMQQLAEPVVAEALRDIGQQPQMCAVCPFGD